ncbi:MAG: glycosyltransferase family 4 protein [Gaiellaceae bacterium]
MERPLRVAHLVSHPIQYFAPLYRELAQRPEIDLTVYYYSDASVRGYHDPEFGVTVQWDTPLLQGYRSVFARNAARTGIDAGVRGGIHTDVLRAVVSGGYDVVWAHGYAYPTSWLALAIGRLRGTPIAIREEQTLLHPRTLRKRLLKKLVLSPVFRGAWGLYIGEQNRRYLSAYGVKEDRLFPARYCVDNDYLRRAGTELAPRREEVRRRLGIDDDNPVILFVGKLIDKKQPLRLLDAYADIAHESGAWLVYVGDGALRAQMEETIAARGLERVRLAGFLNQSEMPAAFVASDVLVLPSALHETWGLVINDALNFGLPVIVSDKVGSAEDLVRPGWNGTVIPHADTAALADAMRQLVAKPELRRLYGERGRELVEAYSISACADGIVAAVQDAMEYHA